MLCDPWISAWKKGFNSWCRTSCFYCYVILGLVPGRRVLIPRWCQYYCGFVMLHDKAIQGCEECSSLLKTNDFMT